MASLQSIGNVKNKRINKRINMAFRSKIRKWGNSYGFLIPREEMHRLKLKPDQVVEIRVEQKPDISSLFGTLKLKRPIDEVIADIKKGYDHDW